MILLGPVYAGLLGLLALHGAHRWWLVARALRAAPVPEPELRSELPTVTVQLPVYNEPAVVARLVDAAAALDWPRDRFEVQLLDDSTDDTAERAAPAVARARAAGVRVSVLRRADRAGFKAGALAAGLAQASGELIAVFDADFVPSPDFLRRLVPHFGDPAVGMVQARWGHLNPDASVLTRGQSRLLDAHFRVEHRGRHGAGCWFNFNGTAGVWRRAAIDAAGGWAGDTLTEDLDLSYRAQLAGWRFVYRDDVVVPAELPETMTAFLAQQRRWARGSVQTFRKLGRRLLVADAPLRLRAEALHHLSSNLAWPLALAVSGMLPLLAAGRGPGGGLLDSLGTVAFVAASGSHAAFLLAAGRARRGDVALALVLALGLAWSQSVAAVAGLLGPVGTFVRTPKLGGVAARGRGGERSVPVELGLALWQGYGIFAAITAGNLRALPFLLWFFLAYGWVAWGRLGFGQAAAVRVDQPLDVPGPGLGIPGG